MLFWKYLWLVLLSKRLKISGGTVLDGTRTAITEQEFLDEKILVLDATNINKRNQNLAQLLSTNYTLSRLIYAKFNLRKDSKNYLIF